MQKNFKYLLNGGPTELSLSLVVWHLPCFCLSHQPGRQLLLEMYTNRFFVVFLFLNPSGLPVFLEHDKLCARKFWYLLELRILLPSYFWNSVMIYGTKWKMGQWGQRIPEQWTEVAQEFQYERDWHRHLNGLWAGPYRHKGAETLFLFMKEKMGIAKVCRDMEAPNPPARLSLALQSYGWKEQQGLWAVSDGSRYIL